MLADGRQHLVEHPAFKPFRRRQLAVDDQAVNIAFRDECHGLISAGGGDGTFRSTPGMVANGLAGIGISQCSSYIRTAKQHLPVMLQSADTAKLRIFENFYMVHAVPPCIMFWTSKKRLLPAACVHIVIYLSRVVVVHGGGGVEQHGQQILLHVADFGGVVV